MKNVLGIVYKLLTDNSTVNAAVSGKVYPTTVPQKAVPPFIRTTVISNVPVDNKNEASTVDVYRVQIDCIDTTYTGAFNLASYVRSAIDRHRGSVTLTSGAVFVDGVRFLDENAGVEFEKDLFAHMLDFQIRLHQ